MGVHAPYLVLLPLESLPFVQCHVLWSATLKKYTKDVLTEWNWLLRWANDALSDWNEAGYVTFFFYSRWNTVDNSYDQYMYTHNAWSWAIRWWILLKEKMDFTHPHCFWKCSSKVWVTIFALDAKTHCSNFQM